MKRITRTLPLVFLLAVCVFAQNPPVVFIQLGTVNAPTTTFTDATCPDGQSCAYEVTAFNGSGESAPSNVFIATIPATGTHTVTLNWVPGVCPTGQVCGAPTGYNIKTARSPLAPGLTGVVN